MSEIRYSNENLLRTEHCLRTTFNLRFPGCSPYAHPLKTRFPRGMKKTNHCPPERDGYISWRFEVQNYEQDIHEYPQEDHRHADIQRFSARSKYSCQRQTFQSGFLELMHKVTFIPSERAGNIRTVCHVYSTSSGGIRNDRRCVESTEDGSLSF